MRTSYPFQSILLSGMPCTGKDTLSHRLVECDSSFAFLRKHKADSAPGSRPEEQMYIHVSPETFWTIAHRGGFIQFHHRYGRMYGVSQEEYAMLLNASKIPLIHVGKYENLRPLREGGLRTSLSLLLWADRAVVQSRLLERHKQRMDGVEERLTAYDEEVAQLRHSLALGELDFDLVFVNNGPDPAAAADALLSLLRSYQLRSEKGARDEIRRLLF